MNRGLTALGALVLSAGLAAACSASSIPAGVDTTAEGEFTSGWACACPNGVTSCKLPCPDGTTGSCENGQPFCDIQVGDAGLACACPSGQSSCSITCPDGALGSCSGGKPTCPQPVDGGTGDAGGCCPAGYESIDCTNPDGTKGDRKSVV